MDTKITLKIQGMTCVSCEIRISNAVKRINGVESANANFNKSNLKVVFDNSIVNIKMITSVIEKLGYKVDSSNQADKATTPAKMNATKIIGIGIIIVAAYIIISRTVGFNFIPTVNQSMGYGILFVVGILTSLHCIAMCGGINISQCATYKVDDKIEGKFSKLKPSFLYNLGRVISYTVIGGIVGAIGSVFSFSGTAKGVVVIIAGVFMLIMGLNMLNLFPWLRKLTPRMPKIFGNKIYNNKGRHGPLYVGLLNGLMPCGPLQSMQLYALGTGSFIAGATSMLVFSLGTVPLMFGLGAISTLLSSEFTKKMLKVSAVLVMVLGVLMISRGMNISGINIAQASNVSSSNVAKVQGNVQIVKTNLESGKYSPIVVQKGIPVKWTISATQSSLNGCNETMTIPKFNYQKKLVSGDNLIEFTPQDEGTITYTCWMGMISSTIKVVSDVSKTTGVDVAQSTTPATGSSSGLLGAGGCCAASAQATKFAGGKIPTDTIGVAKKVGDTQEVTVTVNDQGYSPAVVVVQKGVKAKIIYNTEKLNSCNYIIAFPEYNGQIDLNKNKETPYLTPQKDFTFQCGMGMLHGYVKVVDDINKVDIEQVKKDVQAFKPAAGSGGCCG